MPLTFVSQDVQILRAAGVLSSKIAFQYLLSALSQIQNIDITSISQCSSLTLSIHFFTDSSSIFQNSQNLTISTQFLFDCFGSQGKVEVRTITFFL